MESFQTWTFLGRCPRCGYQFDTRTRGTSRTDNETEICGPCCAVEAMEQNQFGAVLSATRCCRGWTRPTMKAAPASMAEAHYAGTARERFEEAVNWLRSAVLGT
jgi:hypothetical protein